eukprot:12833318-Alexandrium_andersonii.AAC.1
MCIRDSSCARPGRFGSCRGRKTVSVALVPGKPLCDIFWFRQAWLPDSCAENKTRTFSAPGNTNGPTPR